jgi:hypothetical protein
MPQNQKPMVRAKKKRRDTKRLAKWREKQALLNAKDEQQKK